MFISRKTNVRRFNFRKMKTKYKNKKKDYEILIKIIKIQSKKIIKGIIKPV